MGNPCMEALLNAPMSWDSIKYSPAEPVMDKYPLGMFEPDWYTTYEGGHGFVSHSKGIDHYIEEGGNLIERLNANRSTRMFKLDSWLATVRPSPNLAMNTPVHPMVCCLSIQH